MTREAALLELRRLAHGLMPDLAGSARLLERVSQHEDHEALRDALTELGAQALLDSPTFLSPRWNPRSCEAEPQGDAGRA